MFFLQSNVPFRLPILIKTLNIIKFKFKFFTAFSIGPKDLNDIGNNVLTKGVNNAMYYVALYNVRACYL